uniref:Clp protease proteolytic subunit n=1 Tax=Exacum affine TaxID=13525 RepID=A0A7T7FM70_EXAAF|nr:clp protease proteolytic subunit [Exacum affine]QQL92358.1 clp protease proteolytic subunit [Exacum affine]
MHGVSRFNGIFYPGRGRNYQTSSIPSRLAPNIRVMIHQPASSFYEAQTGEFILEAEELLKLRETITRVYVQRTGKSLWVVSEDMERDVFMSATEAQTYGIVDLVAVE